MTFNIIYVSSETILVSLLLKCRTSIFSYNFREARGDASYAGHIKVMCHTVIIATYEIAIGKLHLAEDHKQRRQLETMLRLSSHEGDDIWDCGGGGGNSNSCRCSMDIFTNCYILQLADVKEVDVTMYAATGGVATTGAGVCGRYALLQFLQSFDMKGGAGTTSSQL